MNTYLEVTEFKTKKVVKRYDVTGRPDRIIDKFDNCLNINLNHDKYYTMINRTKRKYNCDS
jgi:hypothetical protein